MSDSSISLTLEEIYSDSPLDDATVDAILNQSLHPRPATMLYDKMAALGSQTNPSSTRRWLS